MMNDKTIEQFRKFKFDFESDNDARPSQLDTWKHQQKRIDEIEEQLKIAVEVLEDDCGGRCNAEYNPCVSRKALNKIRNVGE